MFDVLANRTYRHLFLAQMVALVGTGLATVALGLLAYDLAGSNAGAVLGTALALKMVAYVVVAPIAGAYANLVGRRTLLVALDIGRLAVVLLLPFVDQIWQIYVLIFVLQSCSAAFTPTFQATIPDVLKREADYTKALSLSRLAYDLENLLSPALAALLLMVISYHGLFLGTAVGFLGSALLVVSVALPKAPAAAGPTLPFRRKLGRGMPIYLATPRLRGLLALTLTAAAGSAMVIVNTVVIVRGEFAGAERDVALVLAAFGAGSMAAAFALPRLLERIPDRAVMLFAGVVHIAALVSLGALWSMLNGRSLWWTMLIGWCLLGASYAALVTPGGRLLRRSSQEADRPALYAAQFSLSHVCWLVTYPIAGWVASKLGIAQSLWALSALATLGVLLAWRFWPSADPAELAHEHADLPPDHPHLSTGHAHAHAFVIDDLHARWPDR